MVPNATDLARFVADHFCEVTAPEVSVRFDFMAMRPGGQGGGMIRKPGNILLNWRRLLMAVSESTLAGFGVAQQPWLIPFAALVIWNTLWSTLEIKIDERHAAVIWALWLLRDESNKVSKASLPSRLNEKLGLYGQPPLTPTQLQLHLADLERMKCLESKNSEYIWLREWVRPKWD